MSYEPPAMHSEAYSKPLLKCRSVGHANQAHLVLMYDGRPGAKKDAKKTSKPEDDLEEALLFDEYDAVPLRQNEGKALLEFEILDEALDEFYAKVLPLYHSWTPRATNSPALTPAPEALKRVYGNQSREACPHLQDQLSRLSNKPT